MPSSSSIAPLVRRRRWRRMISTGAEPPRLSTRRRKIRRLERVGVGLAGADAHRALDPVHENLAVADLSGLGGIGDRLHDLLDLIVVDCDVEAYLGQEIHGVFGAAIDFLVSLLAAVALDLGNGH